MSNLSGLVIVVGLVEAALVAVVFLALRLFHQRKYRATKIQLASLRKSFADAKSIRRFRLLAVLDTMLARNDRLIDGLAGSARRSARPALAASKQQPRKRR